MLSQNDMRSVTYMINHTPENDYPFLKAQALIEIDMFRSQCLNRMLNSREQNALEFAIATITHLNLKELHSNCSKAATQH